VRSSTPATSTSTGRTRGGREVANRAVNSDTGGTTPSASTQAQTQTAAKPTPREEAMDNWEFMVLDVSVADQHGFSFAAPTSTTKARTELPDYSFQRCLLHPRFLCRSLVSHVCHGICLGNQVEGGGTSAGGKSLEIVMARQPSFRGGAFFFVIFKLCNIRQQKFRCPEAIVCSRLVLLVLLGLIRM
jgi:hypothetical protein